MMQIDVATGHQLRVARTFRAPPERVFDAWTDPDQVRAWYRPDPSWSVPSVQIDLRVGGTYRWGLQMPGRDAFYETGEFVEVDPPRRLVYTQRTEGPGSGEGEQILVTVTFEPADGGTEVVVVEQGYADERVRDIHASGWPRFLDTLASVLTP